MQNTVKKLVIATGVVFVAGAGAFAQEAPDLKGTWTGPFRTAILGNNAHHPGTQKPTDPARVREIDFTFDIEGQDGRLVWGTSWSNPERKEPFVATISADGKSFIGADTDGSLTATINGSDGVSLCYTQTGLGPSQAIVASCGELTRAK